MKAEDPQALDTAIRAAWWRTEYASLLEQYQNPAESATGLVDPAGAMAVPAAGVSGEDVSTSEDTAVASESTVVC